MVRVAMVRVAMVRVLTNYKAVVIERWQSFNPCQRFLDPDEGLILLNGAIATKVQQCSEC